MRAVGRLIVTLVGFIVAVVAAAAFMMLARLGPVPGGPDEALLFWSRFGLGLGMAASMLGATALAPALLMILAAEILRLRSLAIYVGAGCLLAAAAAFGLSPMMRPATVGDGRATLLIAAGVVGGAVYWLVAGRTAGLTRPDDPVPPGNDG